MKVSGQHFQADEQGEMTSVGGSVGGSEVPKLDSQRPQTLIIIVVIG